VLSTRAPAKVNRELRVGPRRDDGFHEIRSRFASLDLVDRIEARESDRLELACDPPDLPADRSNLVFRAAEALASRLGREPAARIRLSKSIPTGAGLGGGSSDAAATLRLLGRLWGNELPDEELAGIAASLGSDVPFFLSGGEADVSGRGENVTPREDGPLEELILVTPPFAISTAEVYAAFDRIGRASSPPERLEIETSGRFFGPNDLERAVVAVRAEMSDYLRTGRDLARECTVTGSGSTVVLVGAGRDARSQIARRHPGARVMATRTISRDEYRRRVEIGAAEEAAKA
jgi:4-diphosphocytidyl-2-C-methyl-D-erythritol kinase